MVRIQLRLEIEWVDHRLDYHHLQQGGAPNILAESELDNIWIPSLVFANTENREVTRLISGSEVKVKILGNASKSGLDLVDEIYIFKGNENPLIWTERYQQSIKCIFSLEMFPFDIQVTQF